MKANQWFVYLCATIVVGCVAISSRAADPEGANVSGAAQSTDSEKSFRIFGGAILETDNGRVPVMLAYGLPLLWPKALATEGLFPNPLVITIVASKDDKRQLVVADESAVPMTEPAPDATGTVTFRRYAQAVNITWKFAKAGISFETEDGVYVSDKDGATIAFTKKGVVLDGIKKTSKHKEHDAKSLYESGNRLAGQKRYMEAIAEYTKALQLSPANYEALNNRGLAYLTTATTSFTDFTATTSCTNYL